MNDLDKIKDLLGSEDSINRELGIVLALSQGMSLDELVDKCYNEKWFHVDNYGNYTDVNFNDYTIGEYMTEGYSNQAELYKDDDILERDDHFEIFKSMIKLFLLDNYPELLNKIHNK